jgi:hypothetical protein
MATTTSRAKGRKERQKEVSLIQKERKEKEKVTENLGARIVSPRHIGLQNVGIEMQCKLVQSTKTRLHGLTTKTNGMIQFGI